MPTLTCYRLKETLNDNGQPDFDDFVANETVRLTPVGPVSYPDFEAKLYWAATPPREPSWGDFLEGGFATDIPWPTGRSTSALLIIRRPTRNGGRSYFAFTFGPGGRFFLRSDAYRRTYGLKAALNLMYPAGAVPGSGQGLRTVDSKRRASTVVRARAQASSVASFEVFNIDRLRDVVGGVDGRPAESATWGQRVGGTDAISLDRDVEFSELGRLCGEIDAVAGRRDYQAQFAWLDYIQPVTDPMLIDRLRVVVCDAIQAGDPELHLAPPEIVDWSRIHRFQYPFDRRGDILHQDLRLTDLRSVLSREGKLVDLDYGGLHQRRLSVLDVDGQQSYRWTLWSCITGEVSLDGHTYVLDEGDFFEVSDDYLADLNRWVDAVPAAGIELPPCALGLDEGSYNEAAALERGHILLDRQTVLRPGATAIEICDLLAHDRQFIHVKKNSGSSDLSHLFSQGVVSASVLQEDAEFRALAAARVSGLPGGDRCDAFADPWLTSQVSVVFAIIDRRWPNPRSEVLPFFSKVNLRRSVRDLESRGYQVSLLEIGVP